MWKYGGVYSNLDRITTKSFEPLIDNNTNGFSNNNDLLMTFMMFSRIKHSLLTYILMRLSDSVNMSELIRTARDDLCNFNRQFDCMKTLYLPEAYYSSVQIDDRFSRSVYSMDKFYDRILIENCEFTYSYVKLNNLKFD